MLSSIGRASVKRVVARGPQSTNKALQGFWQFQRVDTLQNADNSSNGPQSISALYRSYATATKVATKPKASKTKAKAPKTKTAAKKPVKKAAKKAAKKPVKKKKAVAKKPVKKPRKVLSEAQKLKIEKAKTIANKKALKEAALEIPKSKPNSAWAVVLDEVSKGKTGTATTLTPIASSKYKSLSPAELESYNHIASQNEADNKAAYKKWVESHSADRIRIANNARRSLRLLATKGTKGIGRYTQIKDERQPKPVTSSLALFFKERWESGDFKGIKFTDSGRLICKEWEALSASARQPYHDRVIADKQRYIKEYKAAYGHDVGTKLKA